MLSDGLYTYYKIQDDGGSEPKGSLKIADQQLQIVDDAGNVLHHMFKEGPVSRTTEDIMRSVNRNGYAFFKKEQESATAQTPDAVPPASEQKVIPAEAKSVYETFQEKKSLKKREVIMKGAARRLFPFNPDTSLNENEESDIAGWQHGEMDYDRQGIPEMDKSARLRALNKIAKRTQSRLSPRGDGKREFLLHRGMSPEERENIMSESGKEVMHGDMSSWTPHYDTALNFAKTYTDNHNLPEFRKPVSAWIHEDRIHSMPKQYGKVLTNPLGDEVGKIRGKNKHANEDEVVVNAHRSELHEQSGKVNFGMRIRPGMSLQEAITDRGSFGDETYNQKQIKGRVKKSEPIQEQEQLEKADFSNKIRTGLTGLAIAAASVTGPNMAEKTPQDAPGQVAQTTRMHEQKPIAPANTKKDRILGSIMDVESSGGKDTAHDRLPAEGIHRGERAYGNFGLTPVVIRETIKLHPELSKQHKDALSLTGAKLHSYMGANPGLEQEVASKHYDRLARHFGENADKISMAWINGITGTKKAIKAKEDLKNHWHVAKVLKAYEARKKGQK
jgi:hypothetical protein